MSAKRTEAQKKSRQLRMQGFSLLEISKKVGASKGSVSVWVRDIPQPEKFTPEYRQKEKEKKHLKIKARRLARKKEQDRHIREVATFDKNGRCMIKPPDNYKGHRIIKGRYVFRYRYIMEQHLGRLLKSNEIIHHINGDCSDDRIENLKVMTRSTHASLHQKLKNKKQTSSSLRETILPSTAGG